MNRGFVAIRVMVWLAVMCLSNWVQAQTGEGSSWQFRHDLFQLLLEEQQLKVTESIEAALDAPKSSVIVVAEDAWQLYRVDEASLVLFVERGGALLVVRELNTLAATRSSFYKLGTFYRGPVFSDDPNDQYENFADCVRITNINSIDNLFAGVAQVVTNRAGWFEPFDSNNWVWNTVASYASTVSPLDSRGKPLIVIGKPRGDAGGIAVIMADASMLTNGMLWHGDNAKLALRLAALLKGESRRQFAMIRNNQVLSSATERLAEQLKAESARQNAENMVKPKPTFDQLLKLGNIVAKEVANSNVLNEALQRQPRNLLPTTYFRALVIALTTLLLLWVLCRMLRSRSLRELWLARRRQRYAYEIHAGNEAGDYRTAASYLAREFCIQWTGSHYSRDWQQALAMNMLRGPVHSPADRHELTRIVDIASRGCHERMLGSDFQKFGQTIQLLRRYIAVPNLANPSIPS